ncbi:MAG: AAA family ATPase [Caldilineaceae bacterium SB0664_bin_22]|nr:AAA family ATPase [Caldilineaceae bacterium SB0664_bin_22]
MRLLHWLKVTDFKRFGESQRIELDHPSVLIGPNNSGKTTALQAIALWSQAVKTWYESKGKAPPAQRTSTSLNRLNIVAVPVQRTRLLWHNATVRTARTQKAFHISLGLLYEGTVQPVTMTFTHTQDELVYCTPDEATIGNAGLIAAAARLKVGLLYPMSGLETEEPVLKPGYIEVLLGQGQTAQVLRNLCLTVYRQSPNDWTDIVKLISRLFEVQLDPPEETTRGIVELVYRQHGSKSRFDLELAGRGMQQMLLILAYLFVHRRSVLLIDEPDAHLEILRQKQVYALLTEMADQAESQVILATHSEVVLGEALDTNLTLLMGGKSVNLPSEPNVKDALAYFGTDHYVRARQTGHVLYVEGRTDVEILKALARKLDHPVYDLLDGRLNSYYVQSNHPQVNLDSRLEEAEGGYGLEARKHFFILQSMLPQLKGLEISDGDGKQRQDIEGDNFSLTYWKRYEIENYIVTPEVLIACTKTGELDAPLFAPNEEIIKKVLDNLILECVFEGQDSEFSAWKHMDPDGASELWPRITEARKLSVFAEEFFRQLGEHLGRPILLRKSGLYRLVEFLDPASIPSEVNDKLDRIAQLFDSVCGEGDQGVDTVAAERA